MLSPIEKSRLKWACRRGMLELDVIFMPFFEHEFDSLSDDELAVLVQILDLPDQEFLALVNQKESTNNPAFIPLLHKIRQAKP